MTPTRFVLVTAIAASAAACSTYTQDLSATDSAASVPAISHTPMTSEFRLGPEIEGPASWPSLNDRKLRLGGHRGHLGDAPADDGDPAPAPMEGRFRRLPLPDGSGNPR